MNRRREEVGYRPFEASPVLQKQVLPIDYYDGDLERRVAAGLARIADTFAQKAATEAQFVNENAGEKAALAGAPTPGRLVPGDVSESYVPPGGLRVTVPPASISSAINEAARVTGEDAGTLRDFAFLESSYDPAAVNGSMKGLFQFSPGTARDYGLTNPMDARQSSIAAAQLLRDNRAALRKALGRDPSSGELYLAHQQGRRGALSLLERPGERAVDVVGRDAVLKNGGREDMTAGDFAKMWTDRLSTTTLRDASRRAGDLPIVIAGAKDTGRSADPDVSGIKPAVIDGFKNLQNAWGKSIPIVSGYRDAARNDKAGGAKHSQHLHGNAIDLDVRDMPLEQRKELIRTASAMGFNGIGVYENSLHIDMGARRSWGPSYKDDSIPGWAKDVIADHLAGKATSTQADSYAKLPDNADGPVKVTPVQTEDRWEPGKPGTWRPSGQNTIAGRAYDVAGTRTYLQMAKMTMVEEQQQIFDQYRNDPATLDKAFDQLLEDHKRRNIYFDEIAADYEVSFRSRALDLMEQSRAEARKLKDEQDLVDFRDRVSGLEDTKSRLTAGLDPRGEQTQRLLEDAQTSIDQHYDSAVSRRLMSPADAQIAKRESRSAMVVDYYTRQATGLPAADVEVLRKKINDDHAANKLPGVTAADWAKIDSQLVAIGSQRKTHDDKADADLRSRGDELFTRMLRGEPADADQIARMRTDAATAPAGSDILQSTEARLRLANALRTQPIGEVERRLDDILKREDGSVPAEDVEFARAQIAETRKNLTVDPLGQAEKFGIVAPVPPIALDSLADPAALRDALAYRRGAAVAAAKHFGVPVRYFRPGEADQVAAQAMANPDAMVAFTLNASQAFGKDTPVAMAEIAENGPVMAHAVGVSIATGDASLARDVATISRMKQSKEFTLKMPDDGTLAVKGATYLAGTLASQPKMQNAVLSTAGLLFQKMAAEQGFDPAEIKTAGSVADIAYQRALDRALGGQRLGGIETGGIGLFNDRTIVVPALMPKDRPQALVYGLTTAQMEKLAPIGTINGVPIRADQIKNGYLLPAGDGLYRVALDDPDGDDPQYLITPDGKPWLLDIRALDALAKAVPDDPNDRLVPGLGYQPLGAN